MKITHLPEVGKTLVLHDGKHIAFVRLDYDNCPQNPLEDCDGYGAIISLNTRHRAFDKERFDDNYEDPDCVMLSYYEHGNCLWYVMDCAPPGADCPWDSTRVAGLWIPDSVCRHELKVAGSKKSKPGPRRERAESLASNACEIFTAWCNGSVYEWSLDVYTARLTEDGELYDELRDYRHYTSLVDEGSCACYRLSPNDDLEIVGTINDYLEELSHEENI